MLVLGIESSCDETAVALVTNKRVILCNEVFSQIDTHAKIGGVVPEVAARAHSDILPIILQNALEKNQINHNDITAIASTVGPGLYGGLLVGSTFAKTLAIAWNKPFIAINHLEAHLLTPRLIENVPFPYLSLLISGGNTLFVIVHDIGNYEVIGETQDDALGEAYDKTARLLGYTYPGGKHIETLSAACTNVYHKFKPPMLYTKNCNMSFSGLKTAVNQSVIAAKANGELTINDKLSIAKAFETAILTVLQRKTIMAIEIFKSHYKIFERLVVTGGVAANYPIRKALKKLAKNYGGQLISPPTHLCGDNAAMVSWVGIERIQKNLINPLEIESQPVPNLRL